MDGAERGEGVGGGEAADGLEVLNGDALVVLGAAGEDAGIVRGVVGGREGRVEPLGGLSGDGVYVGVEEDGGEGGVGAGPGDEKEGF